MTLELLTAGFQKTRRPGQLARALMQPVPFVTHCPSGIGKAGWTASPCRRVLGVVQLSNERR